jgi:hypothetical protein
MAEAETVTEIWPDNIMSVNVFVDMGTQWRIGVNGASGLDYNALPVVMRLTGVKAQDRQQVFSDIRVMEEEVLTALHEKRK